MKVIINLFSVFDPCTGIISINWLRSTLLLCILPYGYWILPSNVFTVLYKVIIAIYSESSSLVNYKGIILIMVSIFVFILFRNFIGLIPYIYTSPAHLIFPISIALPLWISFIIYGWWNKSNYIFSHLVPTGTPLILVPFIIIIETIRNLIRPISLSVRLTANIISGHLLICLIGNNSSSIRLLIFSSFIIVFVTLIIFELAVVVIQSYVFVTLTTLYSREV